MPDAQDNPTYKLPMTDAARAAVHMRVQLHCVKWQKPLPAWIQKPADHPNPDYTRHDLCLIANALAGSATIKAPHREVARAIAALGYAAFFPRDSQRDLLGPNFMSYFPKTT